MVTRDSIVNMPTSYVLDSPGIESCWGARFSATSLLYNGYRVFLGVKQPGCGGDHPPPSSAKVKEKVEIYVYSPSVPSRPVLG
jgi:hypothetical protein